MAIEIAPLIASYGYPVALVGAVFEGETVLIITGLFAHRGILDLPLVIALGAIGGAMGDIAYFTLGRHYGQELLQRYPKFEPVAGKVQALIDRHPELTVFGIRFMYGLRTVGPAVIGTSAIRWPRFLMLNALGALTWSTCWVGAGYLLGEAAERVLGKVFHVERELLIGAIAAAVVVSIALRFRRRRETPPSSSR